MKSFSLAQFLNQCKLASVQDLVVALRRACGKELYQDSKLQSVYFEYNKIKIVEEYREGSDLMAGVDFQFMLPEDEQPYDPREHNLMIIDNGQIQVLDPEIELFKTIIGNAGIEVDLGNFI